VWLHEAFPVRARIVAVDLARTAFDDL